MTDSGAPFDQRMISRAVGLGLVVFVAFAIVAAARWALGTALGLGTVSAFFLAACAGPVLVGGVVLLWFFSRSPARRQAIMGVSGQPAADQDD